VALERIKRTRKGDFHVRLTGPERDALRSGAELVRSVLDEGDPREDAALKRLFPPAYMDDAEQAAEFDALVHEELLDGRRKALEELERTIDAVRLNEEELTAWLSAINDARLVLGVRLGVTEESVPADFADEPERTQAYSLYAYLSWLEEDLVDALAASAGR
jgi:hypothetical protein